MPIRTTKAWVAFFIFMSDVVGSTGKTIRFAFLLIIILAVIAACLGLVSQALGIGAPQGLWGGLAGAVSIGLARSLYRRFRPRINRGNTTGNADEPFNPGDNSQSHLSLVRGSAQSSASTRPRTLLLSSLHLGDLKFAQ